MNCLQDFYHLNDEQVSNMVEFHSMLGKYSKAKNRYELMQFERQNDRKTKFMLLMNSGNDLASLKSNVAIDFRLTNLYNLRVQHFGKLGDCLSRDESNMDSVIPIYIDLVGNMFLHILEKDKYAFDDLDCTKIAVDWINNNGGIIPNINSLDKTEQAHVITLQNMKSKYLAIKDKKQLTPREAEILRLGDLIDLWFIDFPKQISSEKSPLFDSNEFLNECYVLYKDIDDVLNISVPEKKRIIIETIQKLCGLPQPEGKNKRLFSDGTNQRNFYDWLSHKKCCDYEKSSERDKNNRGGTGTFYYFSRNTASAKTF